MIHGYAAYKAKEELKPFSYEPKQLETNEVEIKVTHCGICHSDLHLIDNDWMMSTYPFVPGHEVAGIVVRKGEGVTHLEPGDRVGLGWQSGSCHTCEQCEAGHENLCASSQGTCVGRHGGYADHVIADAAFTIKLPVAIESEYAGPLMCGGVTVFSPLWRFGVKKGTKVAVIGIGGLGHMAIQFAAKMGAEVTAISTSDDKEAEVRSLGATGFINSKREPDFAGYAEKFDLILSTVFARMDWQALVNTLRPRGELCFLGALGVPVEISAFSLLTRERKVSGSATGSPDMLREMLDFAAKHGVRPMIEKMPMKDVNLALKKVAENRVRYRMVLVNE